MSRPAKKKLNRRQLLKATGLGVGSSFLPGAFGILPGTIARSQSLQESNRKLVLIYLSGGWNAHFSVDPIIGDRRGTGAFEDVYDSHDIQTPGSKDQLPTGIGFQNALPAFSSVNTAFINGMYVDIPAHDSASAYMLTGKANIGRTNADPAFPAVVAESIGGFASHIILGGGLPLGETMGKAPPLITRGQDLADLLSPPGNEYTAETRATIESMLTTNDERYYNEIGQKSQASLEAFRTSQSEIAEVFEKFGSGLEITEALGDRYNVNDFSPGYHFAASYLALKTGLTRIMTVRFGGFDTHATELTTQLPLQQSVSTALNSFVEDLRNNPDPDNPNQSIMDNTTIVLTSEFVRTPRFNARNGTDHQNTASALVMGAGVKDNKTFGATDETGEALGWENDKAVERNDETKIDGAVLVASLLDSFGLGEQATAVHKRRIEGLFG